MYKLLLPLWGLLFLYHLVGCKKEDKVPGENSGTDTTSVTKKDTFYFGADLSYVNQILDHGGRYKNGNTTASPYQIFKEHGANLVRVRLWHQPTWTKEVYGASGQQLYHDLNDVEKTIRLAKAQGMEVLLDFHYSDIWADPDKQEVPKAWKDIKEITVLKDSVYQYTHKTLSYLQSKNLMPEIVQLGNEINCGLFYTNAVTGFPTSNGCNGEWQRLGEVLNSGIKAVRDVTASSSIKTKIALHIADPKHVEWWFDQIGNVQVRDYDIIGFSYYPLWHTTVKVDQISDYVSKFRTKYNKKVMILETAYPWTSGSNDAYTNLFGSQTPIAGYPFTVQGQLDLLKTLTQKIKDGGGIGIVYWEPAWISSSMKDLYGTGSAWENVTLFDFNGAVLPNIDYMKYSYK
jgi:arabinogalactan endo-1,4-beta-galactosidase